MVSIKWDLDILKNIDDKTSNVGTGTSAIADTTW